MAAYCLLHAHNQPALVGSERTTFERAVGRDDAPGCTLHPLKRHLIVVACDHACIYPQILAFGSEVFLEPHPLNANDVAPAVIRSHAPVHPLRRKPGYSTKSGSVPSRGTQLRGICRATSSPQVTGSPELKVAPWKYLQPSSPRGSKPKLSGPQLGVPASSSRCLLLAILVRVELQTIYTRIKMFPPYLVIPKLRCLYTARVQMSYFPRDS